VTKSANKHDQLTEWVHTYSDSLYQWAYHKTLHHETALDLVQETFLAATHGFDSFRGESSAKTWLFRILNHKITDYYRSSYYKKSTLREQIDENTGDAIVSSMFTQNGDWHASGPMGHTSDDDLSADNPAFVALLTRCMDDLPAKWRQAVTARYLTDQDPKIICQELGITPSNYWQILHRAKLLLKKCITGARNP
jgi:RNA polymerase sigma factor (sigma-70 family)